MATKAKRKKERPGVQVVLRVPGEVRALLEKMAHEGFTSMKRAATVRLSTGRWPRQIKEGKKS